MLSIKSHVYRWLFIGLFTATPFFMPSASAEVVPAKDTEIAGASFGVYYGSPRYGRRPYRYRYYPRRDYYYNYGDPYYRSYYGPYYRYRYDRYPRGGGGVYFRVK